MDARVMRSRLSGARVARLATVTSRGEPRVVPCCFATEGEAVYSAVDDVKPKSTLALTRLERIRDHPVVSLLVDHYDDDWNLLWWIRIDGSARVVDAGESTRALALELLAAKYVQYREQPPPGPVVEILIERWSAWP